MSITENSTSAVDFGDLREHYIFMGLILPERAGFTHEFVIGFHKPSENATVRAHFSIHRGQVVVYVDTDVEWDIYTLRNTIASTLQTHVATIGFLRGYAYSVDLTRVINRERGIDFTFGINIPCIAEPRANTDWQSRLQQILAGYKGDDADNFVSSCFRDLTRAMQTSDDTPLFCCRAVESLKAHCAITHGTDPTTSDPKLRAAQWHEFRTLIKMDRATVENVTESAKQVRHGHVVDITGEQRAKLFKTTWEIVESYLAAIKML
jgi:hypothetical protein